MTDDPDTAVDAFIDKIQCECASYDSVLEMINSLHEEHDIYMFHLDVKGAFRLVPVRREDWHLQVFKWKGRFLFDKVLVFGCRTSPPIWRRVGSALEFIFAQLPNISVSHHVDDFLFVVAIKKHAPQITWQQSHVEVPVAGSTERKQVVVDKEVPVVAVQSFVDVLSVGAKLGVPWSWDKNVSPTQMLVHLGVELNTKLMRATVPPRRLQHTMDVIRSFLHNRFFTTKGLQSLIGKLAFVCRVFPPGRCFLNRLLSTLRVYKDAKRISMVPWLKADLEWWLWALPVWKGISTIPRSKFAAFADEHFGTDACNIGYGAHWNGQFFSAQWSQEHLIEAQRAVKHSMPWMELYAVAAAVTLWSHHWRGRRVIVKVDCEPASYWINKGNTTRQQTVNLLRSIADHCVTFGFELMAVWVEGQTNVLADALSRLNVDLFLQSSSGTKLSGQMKPPGMSTVLSAHGRLT